jgi:hypothetical protein
MDDQKLDLGPTLQADRLRTQRGGFAELRMTRASRLLAAALLFAVLKS